MKFSFKLFAKIRASWSSIRLVFVVSAFLIGGVLSLHFWRGTSIQLLTKDITTAAGVPFYYGFLSQIGILFWAGTVTVCLLSFSLCSNAVGHRTLRKFFLASALLTAMLGLDDLFLAHEVILQKHIGIPEAVTFSTYGALVVLYFLKFYPIILKTAYIPLISSLFFFSLSILLDIGFIPVSSDSYQYLLEDGTKIIGILSWLVYYFEASKYAARLGQSLKVD